MKIAIIADNLGNNAPGLVFRNILTGLSKKIEFDIITSTLDYRAPKEHRGSVNYVPQKRIPSWRLRTFLFNIFGFSPERAMAQFGFLINAFKYGAPPHAGLAFGLDRFVSVMAGLDSIRDCIAFPKNNSGRDVMLDAPSALDEKQLDELQIKVDLSQEN